ncbi:unnamed protein product [Cuscuta epithymum]|uniref:Uncharacterized protein n=1 Tax=Cuscuta epithymum TaxID=186058 RepID=A0AAV0ET22_9ASTE|nr:unnamed protein product [Cuscuta epithymum]
MAATQTIIAIDDQDFSFPTTLESPPLPLFLDMPPAWWRSTVAASSGENPMKGGEQEEENVRKDFSLSKKEVKNIAQRRSFSCIEGRTKRRDYGDEEEKMDMLWEDFNDDYYKRSCSELSTLGKLEIECLQSLKLSSNKPIKRPAGMVFVMKVLIKKVFLIHNSDNPSLKKLNPHN